MQAFIYRSYIEGSFSTLLTAQCVFIRIYFFLVPVSYLLSRAPCLGTQLLLFLGGVLSSMLRVSRPCSQTPRVRRRLFATPLKCLCRHQRNYTTNERITAETLNGATTRTTPSPKHRNSSETCRQTHDLLSLYIRRRDSHATVHRGATNK